MRLGSVKRSYGPRVPRGPDWIDQVPSAFRVPTGGRGYPPPRQGRQAAKLDRESSVANRLNARQKAAVTQPATPSDHTGPPRDQAPPLSLRRRAGPGAFLFSSGALSGLHAAWLVVAALLLGLAILSAVSDPPRPPSPDELARASIRTPHERATSGQY